MEASGQILIIGGDQGASSSEARLLRQAGYTVRVAAEAAEGLRLATELPPDLILLHVDLPDADGLEVCRRLKADPQSAESLLLLIGHEGGISDERADGLEAGADGYLIRPVSERDLLTRIEIMLRLRQAERQTSHLKQVLQAVLNINQIVVREKDRVRLVQQACDHLVAARDYHHAWIVVLDDVPRLIGAASSGESDISDMLRFLNGGGVIPCLEMALKTEDVQVITDPETVCADCPLVTDCTDLMGLSVSMRHKGVVHGVLSVSVSPAFGQSEEEHALLKEIAGDLALALHNIEAEELRRQAEEALRRSEARYRALIDQNPAGIAIHSEGVVRYVNETAVRLAGATDPDQLLGKQVLDFVHPDDQAAAMERVARVQKGHPADAERQRFLRLDGKEVYVETAAIPTTYRGRPAVLSVFWDVTEQVEIEEALRRYAEEQRTIHVVAAAAASSLDPRQMLTTVLDTVLPLLDASAGWVELIGPTLDDPPRLIAHRNLTPAFVEAEESLPLRECPVCAPLLENAEPSLEPMLCAECPRLPAQVVKGAGLHSHVGIPLSAGPRVLGVLNIAWDRPVRYDSRIRATLLTIGQQTGLALRNAQLYQEARQLDRLRFLNELSRDLAATLDPDKMIEIVLKRVAEVTGATLGAAFIFPPQGDGGPRRALTLNYGWIEIDFQIVNWRLLRPTVEQLQESGDIIPLRAQDLARMYGTQDARLLQEWGEHGLLVPIVYQGRLSVVLALGGREEPFSEEDQALMQAAAAHAAQFIRSGWQHRALAEAEARFRELYHNVPVGLYRITADGRFLAVNRVLVQMLGYPDEETLLATPAVELYAGAEDGQRWWEHVEDPCDWEVLARRYDGSLIWLHGIGRRVLGPEGQVLYYEGSVIDITDRKKAEDALREAERRYRTVADFTYDWEYWEAPDGRWLYVSPACERITGYAPDEFIANPRLVDELIVEQDREMWAAHRHKAGQGAQQALFRIRRRDGDLRWIEHWCQPVTDEDGQFLGYRASNRDVTDRVQAEAELRRSQANLAEAQHIAHLGSWEWDIPSGKLWWSEEVYRIFGQSRGDFEATYENFLKTIPLEDRVIVTETVAHALYEHKAYDVQHRILRPDGTERVVRERAEVIFDEEGRPLRMVGTVQDVTERVQLEERLSAIYRLGRELILHPDEEEIVRRVLSTAADVLHCDFASYGVVDQESGTLRYRYLFADGRLREWGLVLPLDGERGVGVAVAQTGQPINIADTAQEPRYVSPPGYASRSELCVPLKAEGRVLGVLNVERRQVAAFTAADMQLLQTLADQVTTALENARLYRNTQEQAERLATLNAISTAITSSLDLDTVIAQLLEKACQALNAETGSILLRDPRTGELIFTQTMADEVHALSGRRLAPGQGIAGWVMQHRESAVVNDVRQDPRFYSGLDEVTGVRVQSLLCVPFGRDQGVGGVIEIINKPGGFNEDDLQFLESIAPVAAIALENAQLYASLQARVSELEILYNLGLLLSSTLDSDVAIETALNQFQGIFQATGISLLRQDPQSREMYFVHTLGKSVDATLDLPIRLEPGEGIAGWVISHGRSILLDDVQKDPRWSDRVDHYLGRETRSLMAVPLQISGQNRGVIEVVHEEPGKYTADDLRTLETVTFALSVALENARLYEEQRRLLREREATQAQLIHSEKMAALGRLTASIAHEINNPLQSVQVCLNLAEEEMEDEQRRDKIEMYLNLASGEIERVANIVTRMRDFYRPARDERRPTDIHETLETVLALTNKKLQHANVTVVREWGELPPIQANPDHLKQVFLNLVLNAIDAMPQGGTLRLRTGLDWSRLGGEEEVLVARVEFSDSGEGVPAEELPRLFEPFFTTKEHGSGLGLFVSANIIEAHGGIITVESEKGEGTTFTILLPVSDGGD